MVKVKEFIARVGIKSQNDLADQLGVSPATVYKWASGERKPEFEMVRKLKRLGITDYELFGETFQSQVDEYKRRITQSAMHFLEEIGINPQRREHDS